jgi:hypothetical protein
MLSTTIYEFKHYYQISPYCHSADPAALWIPYRQPTTSKFSSFETNQYKPPNINVSADRGQSPLSVCSEDIVSYDTSSSQNLHRHTEVLIVIHQTFLVVLRYGGSCKNRLFINSYSRSTRGVREDVQHNTSHIKPRFWHNTTQIKPTAEPFCLPGTYYIRTYKWN